MKIRRFVLVAEVGNDFDHDKGHEDDDRSYRKPDGYKAEETSFRCVWLGRERE